MIDKIFELLCGVGAPSTPALEPSDLKDANFQQLLSLTLPSAPHIVRDSALNKEANARLKTVLSNKSHSPNNTIRTVKTMFEQAIQACDRDKERCMLQWLQTCVTMAVDMAFDEVIGSESNGKAPKRADKQHKKQQQQQQDDNKDDDDDFVVPDRYDRIGESDDDYVPSDENEAIVPAPARKSRTHKGKNGKVPPFTMEIDEGAGSKAVVKYFTQNGTSTALKNGYFAQSYFFPSKESYNAFISVLNSATSTIDVCVFSLTDDDTANALIAAKKRKCKVRIITDDQQAANKYADAARLQSDHGIPYKTDHSPSYMHNKFAIIDGATLINGSFNWSKGARTKNRENIIITNIPECIQAFQKEFDALWAEF